MTIIVVAGGPAAAGEAPRPPGQAEQPFILVDLPHSREFLLSAFRARGLAPRIAHRTRSLEMMRGMVANGLGVSLLITRPRGDRAYDGRRIAHRPLAERPPHQSMLLARPQGLRPTAAAAAFADLIRRHYRDGES